MPSPFAFAFSTLGLLSAWCLDGLMIHRQENKTLQIHKEHYTQNLVWMHTSENRKMVCNLCKENVCDLTLVLSS